MRKKRFIMQKSLVTTFTAPVFLAEKYDKEISELGFLNRQEALSYLVEGIWNERNGKKNSHIVRNILSHVSLERSPIIGLLPRTYRGVVLKEEEREKINQLSDFGYLSNLMNAVMEAFMLVPQCYRRRLRKEMHARYVYEKSESYWIHTFVSENQYNQLSKMAGRGGMKPTGLIRSAVDAMLIAEGLIPESMPVPLELQDAIEESLSIEGFTLSHFSRGIRITINISDEVRHKAIINVIRKYRIPGPNELMRRVILFLLSAKDITLQASMDEEDNEEDNYFDENEMYQYGQLSRKDFVRGIYQ